MTFGLGVDLGTTFTAAAVSRADQPEMVTLGNRSPAIPSVVMIREDGTSIVGDAADRRAASHPARVAREVKRRLGDPTPLILGGEPHSAAQILSRLLRAAVDAAVAREGRRPDGIVLTHPANWGPYKRELFDSVPRLADLTAVSMVTEPEAAAAHYASTARVAKGSVVAVYDLGGGTFDATVLRQLDDRFEFLGPPEGIEGLGGIDFDEAVFAHVDRSLDGALSELDLDDPGAAASLVRVRQDCVLAKEALSGDTETSVPVMLPDLHTEVRLTRGEFEEMIRGPIDATVSALRRALAAAEVTPEDLSNVLLVGGSSRIPIVSQMLSAELGRPTAVDTHPKHAVALGAALLAGRARAAGRSAAPGSPSRGRPAGPPPGSTPNRGRSGSPAPSAPSSTPPGGVRAPGRGAGAPAAVAGAAALAGGAAAAAETVVSTPSRPTKKASSDSTETVVSRPSRPTTRPAPGSGPHSGLLPLVGPPSSGVPAKPLSTGGGPMPPSGAFRAVSAAGPAGRGGAGEGGPPRPPGAFGPVWSPPAASAAGSAPPTLGKGADGTADETRRRRIRMAVLGVGVAAVLGIGGVATAAALTDRTGLSTVAPAPAVPTATSTAAPGAGGAAPVAHAPAVQPADSPAHQASHSPAHPTTTTAPRTTTSKSSSSGGDGHAGSGNGGGTGG